jgi:MFS transporter, DHA3 family, tetracycline resistance protein
MGCALLRSARPSESQARVSRRRPSAYPVYLFLVGATSLFFSTVFTVVAVYRVTIAELNPLQLVLVGTVLELSVLLFEIPTGIVADVYSRKVSIIIGFVLIGCGFMLEGAVPVLAAILLAQVLWGLGWTFTSGAREAWVADELGEENIGRVYLRGAQVGQVTALIGTGVSVALASIWLRLPIILGGAMMVALGIVAIFLMRETNFSPAPRGKRQTWASMRATAVEGMRVVRRRPVLYVILAIGAFYGMSSEAMDRLWQAHLLEYFALPEIGQLDPVVWFGIITAIAMLLSLAATEYVRRRFDTDSHLGAAWPLFAINALLIVSVIAFGLAGNFTMALVTYWVAYLLRATNDPIFDAWINQNAEPKVRATVFSIAGQSNALGQVVGGPFIGAIGTIWSLRAALVAAGVALAPVVPLFIYTIRRQGDPAGSAGTSPSDGDGRLVSIQDDH